MSAEGRTTTEEQTIDDWARPEGQVLLRLAHAGRRGATEPRERGTDLPLAEGWPLVSASPVPYGPYGARPEELSVERMADVRASFVAAARRAAELGVDVLEIDLAHGNLLASFLSPLSNKRQDEFGRDPMAFPISVLDDVRAQWQGPLAVRHSATDWHPRGMDLGDGIAIARVLREHGCDLIHVEAGQTIHDDRPQYRRGYLTALSDRVRNEVRVPTIVGGYLTTLDEANTIIGAGRADLVLLDLPEADIERALPTSTSPREEVRT